MTTDEPTSPRAVEPGRVTVRWRVAGRVQGVGFRWFVQRAAERCGLAGDVCNLPDGSVEVRAQGSPGAVDRLRQAVRRGPPGSRVDTLSELETAGIDELHDFRVRRAD